LICYHGSRPVPACHQVAPDLRDLHRKAGLKGERPAITTAFLIQLGFVLVTGASLALFLLDFEQLQTKRRERLRDQRLRLRVLARGAATLGAGLGASGLGVYVGEGAWAYWPAVCLLIVALVGGALYMRSRGTARLGVSAIEIGKERSTERADEGEAASSYQNVQTEYPRRLPEEQGSSEDHEAGDQPEPPADEQLR